MQSNLLALDGSQYIYNFLFGDFKVMQVSVSYCNEDECYWYDNLANSLISSYVCDC